MNVVLKVGQTILKPMVAEVESLASALETLHLVSAVETEIKSEALAAKEALTKVHAYLVKCREHFDAPVAPPATTPAPKG